MIRSVRLRKNVWIWVLVLLSGETVTRSVSAASFEEWALQDETPGCVRVVSDAIEAFEIRKDLIRSAKKEILLSYYAWVRDIKPMVLVSLLQEAAARGVKVRVILDDFNSRLPKPMLKYLRKNGVEVKYYNPIRLKNIFRADRRMHDKYIVVDRELVLVGGRNLKDGYFNPDLGARKTFYDLDALFLGKPAIEAGEYFDQRWDLSPWVEDTIEPKVMDADYEDFSREVERLRLEMKESGELSKKVDTEDFKVRACQVVDFHANHPIQRKKDRTLERLYIQEIERAQVSVEIQNPYIIPTPPMKKAIKNALRRGVSVKMITNSMKSIDIALTQSAYLNFRPKALRWGVEVYEFIHDQTLHSKIAIFDGKRVLVGSFNLDPRSAKINSETFILTEDPSAVNPVRAFFAQTESLSAKIGKDGKPEGYDERHPGTTFGKRLLNVLFRFSLAPLLRSRL